MYVENRGRTDVEGEVKIVINPLKEGERKGKSQLIDFLVFSTHIHSR